jgi:hypothetical protein
MRRVSAALRSAKKRKERKGKKKEKIEKKDGSNKRCRFVATKRLLFLKQTQPFLC